MISVVKLTKRQLTTIEEQNTWIDLIHEIATRNFTSAPKEDVANLIKGTAIGSCATYIAYLDNRPVGFAAVLYRDISEKGKKLSYLVLDVVCVDKALRNHHIFTTAGIVEMLTFKLCSFHRLFTASYVLAICMSPIAYRTYRLPETWKNADQLTDDQQATCDAILSSHSQEFKLDYKSYREPIHHHTWVPLDPPEPTSHHDERVKYFLRQNPEWKNGNGLPIIFPLTWRNTVALITALIFSKLRRKT